LPIKSDLDFGTVRLLTRDECRQRREGRHRRLTNVGNGSDEKFITTTKPSGEGDPDGKYIIHGWRWHRRCSIPQRFLLNGSWGEGDAVGPAVRMGCRPVITNSSEEEVLDFIYSSVPVSKWNTHHTSHITFSRIAFVGNATWNFIDIANSCCPARDNELPCRSYYFIQYVLVRMYCMYRSAPREENKKPPDFFFPFPRTTLCVQVLLSQSPGWICTLRMPVAAPAVLCQVALIAHRRKSFAGEAAEIN